MAKLEENDPDINCVDLGVRLQAVLQELLAMIEENLIFSDREPGDSGQGQLLSNWNPADRKVWPHRLSHCAGRPDR